MRLEGIESTPRRIRRNRTQGTESEVLRFVRRFIEMNGYSPSYREIQSHLGLAAPTAAKYHIDHLVKDGKLLRDEGRSRSLRLPKQKEGRPL